MAKMSKQAPYARAAAAVMDEPSVPIIGHRLRALPGNWQGLTAAFSSPGEGRRGGCGLSQSGAEQMAGRGGEDGSTCQWSHILTKILWGAPAAVPSRKPEWKEICSASLPVIASYFSPLYFVDPRLTSPSSIRLETTILLPTLFFHSFHLLMRSLQNLGHARRFQVVAENSYI